MMFNTAYQVGKSEGQPLCDNTEEPVLSERINSNGVYEVFQSGTRSFQDVINEAYPSTLLENVLARCGCGDFSGLSDKGFYGDITVMPDNIHEATSIIKNLRGIFDKLPKDVKSQFVDFSDFLKASNDFEAFSKIFTPSDDVNSTMKEGFSDVNNDE